MNITNPADVGLANANPAPPPSEFRKPMPDEHREERRPSKPEVLHLDTKKHPEEGEALPNNTDPLTYMNKTLQKNQELLRLKTAFGKASKEVHFEQIKSRAEKFLKDLGDEGTDKSIRDQVDRLMLRVSKQKYDLTQKRRLRRVLNRGR